MLVSVVIPARTWDGLLEHTIQRIADQVLAPDMDIEVVVGLAGEAPEAIPQGVRVVANPSGTTPDGLNLAIAEARGEVIVRVDSRCVLPPHYVATVVEELSDPRVGCVGGAQLVLDRGRFGSAYAIAFNSVLLGPSRYRFSRRSGPTESPYLGAWRRETLERIGGFDAALIRNQDNELADRVRGLGLEVRYEADLVVGYYNGRSFTESIAHHHEFGYWRMKQQHRGQRGLTWRHVGAIGAAVLAAGGVVGSLACRKTRVAAGALGLAAYLATAMGACLTAERMAAQRRDLALERFDPVGVLAAPAVAAAIDAGWMTGLVRGAL